MLTEGKRWREWRRGRDGGEVAENDGAGGDDGGRGGLYELVDGEERRVEFDAGDEDGDGDPTAHRTTRTPGGPFVKMGGTHQDGMAMAMVTEGIVAVGAG